MITTTRDGIAIDVKVMPRAGRSGITGTRDGMLLVRLRAPPVDGAANAELIAVLCKTLDVPKRAVTIVSGGHSKQKRIHVVGVTAESAASRILLRCPPPV